MQAADPLPSVAAFTQFTPLTAEPAPDLCADVFYDASSKEYLFPKSANAWVRMNETSLRRHLKQRGLSNAQDKGPLSQIELALNTVQLERDVAYSGPLAGYKAGVYDADGQRVLVTNSPRIISPGEGDWPTLREFIERLLNDPDHDQTPYLYGWLKVAIEALANGERRPGQVLVIAGPSGGGKSFLQNVLTDLLGGRAAKPYQYMTGQTTFNADLFTAEHLMVEDEAASTEIRSRRKFGSEIKGIVVNDTNRLHPKGRQAITLRPFWRLSVSVNDEPENLMVLPPLDDSLKDKIMLLRAQANAVPVPTNTIQERQAFFRTIRSELPAFVAFLRGWKIPANITSSRYGVQHYHHPTLLDAISDLSPEMALWNLIESEVLADGEWGGSSQELQNKLVNGDSRVSHEARRILTYPTACGAYLQRLARLMPEAVRCTVGKNKRKWFLNNNIL